MPGQRSRFGNINLNFRNQRLPERNPVFREYSGPSAYDRIPSLLEQDALFERKIETYGGTDTFIKALNDVVTVLVAPLGIENPIDSAHLAVMQLRQVEEINKQMATLPPERYQIVVTRSDVTPEESVKFYDTLDAAMAANQVSIGNEDSINVELRWGTKGRDDANAPDEPKLSLEPIFRPDIESTSQKESLMDKCPKSFEFPKSPEGG